MSSTENDKVYLSPGEWETVEPGWKVTVKAMGLRILFTFLQVDEVMKKNYYCY